MEHKEISGNMAVLLTAPHIKEIGIEQITTAVANNTKSYAIIGIVPRKKIDLNRAVAKSTSFRKRISELIRTKNIKLILDLHGCKPRKGNGEIEIGTNNGLTATTNTVNKLKKYFEAEGFNVKVNNYFKGSGSGYIINTYSDLDKNREAIQIEFDRKIRTDKKGKITNALVTFINSVK